MSDNSDERRAGRLSTDRDTIRRWAEEHGAVPVREAAAGGESDRFRIVPESAIEESHERAEWDDFFASLDEGDHVVVYRGEEETEPFEVTRREEIVSGTDLEMAELEERLVEGEVVTSEIRETTVVETVVVEEATVESELVDTEIVDDRVVDVELVSRECTSCELGEVGGEETRDWFDEERYVTSIDRGEATVGRGVGGEGATAAEGETEPDEVREFEEGPTDAESGPVESGREEAEIEGAGAEAGAGRPGETFPYEPVLEVEEVWDVTRAYTERFIVESRIADAEVAETDTIGERDVDVEGLHRTIAGSDLLDVELAPEELLDRWEVRSEFEEGDRVRTHFDRERIVEEELVDRKRLRADVTDVELLGMEVVHSEAVASEILDEEGMAEAGGAGVEEAETGAMTGETAGRVTLTEDAVGKTVVDAAGEEVGLVTGVDEAGDALYVDAHPGITDRIKAALDWGDADEDDYPVETGEIERITDDEVVLKGAEEIEGGSTER